MQPLLVNAITNDGKRSFITRKSLIAEFGKHYLTLFYSKFDILHPDFKINIIQIDAKPKTRGEYIDYRYKFQAIDDTNPIAARLISEFAEFEPPVIEAYQPQTIQAFIYDDIEIGTDDCI